ncbi:portal domain protein, partial [Escherichia coli RN587/1]
TQMFSCWLEEALLRGIIRPPRARFDFYQARSAWHGQSGLVPEEWPLTGSRKSRNQ